VGRQRREVGQVFRIEDYCQEESGDSSLTIRVELVDGIAASREVPCSNLRHAEHSKQQWQKALGE
jgi:hypothetical protein